VDPAVLRSIARLQYAAARLPFTLLDERVVARYWDQDALVRAGFERWLGSLDVAAGWLLGDDAVSRRGLVLLRLPGDPAQAGDRAAETLGAAGQAPEPGPGAASRAVLQALAEQVGGDRFDLFERLASQLPGDLQAALLAGKAAGQPLQLDAFYQRVSDLAGVPPAEAEGHARVVVATIQEEVVGTPLDELFARLPQEYRSLLPD
jgi:uncharacterized protein (DUF2267 family)